MDIKIEKIRKKISEPSHPMHEFFSEMVLKGEENRLLKNLLFGHRNDHQAFE